MQKNCEHFMGIQEDEQVNPHTKGCEECEKEGSNWVALRMCLHVDILDVVILHLEFMQLNIMKIQDILQ
jgi:hypothetical protein